MAEPFIGEMRIISWDWAPRGWALCDGQLQGISQNQALFSILGTTYGGNGQTTFGLPDLRGRLPMNWGQGGGISNRTIGEVVGSAAVTLTVDQLPQHTHSLQPACNNSAPATDSQSPVGTF